MSARGEARILWIKIALSLFLLLHLSAILILPNPDSILARKWAPIILEYSNILGINTTWRFFSPEPSPAVYFVYDADSAQSDAPAEGDQFWQSRGFITGQWPPENVSSMLAENRQRLVYHSRFTTVSDERTAKFLGNLICRFYSQAYTVSVRAIFEEIPQIENQTLSRLKFDESKRERELSNTEFPCPERGSP